MTNDMEEGSKFSNGCNRCDGYQEEGKCSNIFSNGGHHTPAVSYPKTIAYLGFNLTIAD